MFIVMLLYLVVPSQSFLTSLTDLTSVSNLGIDRKITTVNMGAIVGTYLVNLGS
jgi:hypothetical protein